jgi:hypothetical protein
MSDRAPLRRGVAPAFDLHIEELILHGFERIDRYEVASAIEHEIARLLRGPATQQRLLGRDRTDVESTAHQLDAGSLIVPHNATPHAVGVQVAQAICHSLAPGDASRDDSRQSASRTRSPTAGPGA